MEKVSSQDAGELGLDSSSHRAELIRQHLQTAPVRTPEHYQKLLSLGATQGPPCQSEDPSGQGEKP